MAGLEVLFSVAKERITGQNDALVCCLHWNMIVNGYRCIGSGEEVSNRHGFKQHPSRNIQNGFIIMPVVWEIVDIDLDLSYAQSQNSNALPIVFTFSAGYCQKNRHL